MTQVVVKPGENLSGILKAQGNPNFANPSEWAKVGLSNPNLIHPGQILNLPGGNQTGVSTTQSSPSVQPSTFNTSNAVSTPGFVVGTPDWIKPIIQRASTQYNIPTAMLSALLKKESGFEPKAQSPVGAQGIAQFMPSTAQGMGVNPWDPESAVNGAAKYLRSSWDKFGKPELALAAYNAGGGAVSQYGGIPPYKETQNYVKDIMAMAGDIHETANSPMLDLQKQAKEQMTPKLDGATNATANIPQPSAPLPYNIPASPSNYTLPPAYYSSLLADSPTNVT